MTLHGSGARFTSTDGSSSAASGASGRNSERSWGCKAMARIEVLHSHDLYCAVGVLTSGNSTSVESVVTLAHRPVPFKEAYLTRGVHYERRPPATRLCAPVLCNV